MRKLTILFAALAVLLLACQTKQQTEQQTEYNVNIAYGGNTPTYAYNNVHSPVHVLIRPDDSKSKLNSMSLYLDSMKFTMSGEVALGMEMFRMFSCCLLLE